MEDKRIFERFKIEFSVRFLEVNARKEGCGKMVDISASGCGVLVTQTVLELDVSLEMWLNLPNNKDPFHSRGKVAWCKEVEPGIYRVGVKFDSVDFMSVSRVLRVRNEKNKGISGNV